MVRTQIQFTEEQMRRLRRRARSEGVSVAELVRRLVERGIGEEAPGRQALYHRAARVVGAFRDREGASDVAERHDEYLDRGLR